MLLQLGLLATPEITSMVGYYADLFAARYPQATRVLIEHGDTLYEVKDVAEFYVRWMTRYLGGA